MRSLHLTTIFYSVALAVACLTYAAWHRRRPPALNACITLLAAVAVIVCVADAIHILGGIQSSETATHFGYLVTAPLVLPATAGAVQLEGDRWGSAAMGVGCLVLAVVLVRLAATSGHG